MFTKAVLPDAISAIKKIAAFNDIKKAYLAGGTALALQIGHRISEDLDFFTSHEFNESVLATELVSIGEFKEDRRAWRTVLGRISETKFSIFYYPHPLIGQTVEFEGIKLASKADIAAMKIRAVGDRGTKRDFIDVYFLAKEFSLDQMLEFYDQRYPDLDEKLLHLLKSLTYFEDAENDGWKPQMLVDFNWQEIKDFFSSESLRLARTKLGL